MGDERVEERLVELERKVSALFDLVEDEAGKAVQLESRVADLEDLK